MPQILSPGLVVLVTSMSQEGKANIIPLSWAMPVSFNPPLVAIAVGIKRFSHTLIEASGDFVVNLPSSNLLSEVYFCGTHSGKLFDKFTETGLSQSESEKVKPPKIEECVAHLECKVINKLRAGDHTIFVGKVVAGSADSEAFNESLSILNLNKVKPLYHRGGPALEYFAVVGKTVQVK